MTNRKVQRHQLCEGLAKQALKEMQRPNHKRKYMRYQPIVQGQSLDDRKGELRYDFTFPNTEDSTSLPVFPYKDVHHCQTHTVAPAQTLATPPASLVSSSSSSSSLSQSNSVSEAIRPAHPEWLYSSLASADPSLASADEYREDSSNQRHTELTLVPFIQEPKKHGFYCNIKTTVKSFFQSKDPSNKLIETCKHKFRNERCKKCDVPETIAYLCNWRTGAVCKEHGKSGCEDCVDMIYYGSNGDREDRPTTPIRQTANTGSQASTEIVNPFLTPRTSASVSLIAPTLPTLNFPSISSFLHNHSASKTTTTLGATSSTSLWSPTANPTGASTPVPSSNSSSSSSSFTTWRRHVNTPTPCNNTPSPQDNTHSTFPQEVTYHTAIPVLVNPASPTTVHIRSPSILLTPLTPPSLPHHCYAALTGHRPSQTLVMALYQELSFWSLSDQHLICKTRHVLGLQMQEEMGKVSGALVAKVKTQLFPELGGESMEEGGFVEYMRACVSRGEISESRGARIVKMAGIEAF
ncbi:hypothetical protein PtrSN002B_002296 [Pyrenophora tritici-repentis]|uniref:DUF1421 multi-domain protein n=1 Tax=Pyrenophora tritici-repentis TaxID=45151 RepID=A0A2W1HYL1_9PLEO|nr:Hamartin domain-containing protein [Pyrenophora tritici-repentis]KAF7450920.1 Hamartin domain containing protein [Pyrenophora tritici-repentis]KAF7573591.1 DUF1421 multi-domain protein [Pyrenophora tritici-repentis]KAI0577872.1 Hamartin domain-containing protein [Pyrenophora tritici-repentis]KAI0619688.1 Hamartin domain-containing protein [Pyrenophora tritici-repentis]